MLLFLHETAVGIVVMVMWCVCDTFVQYMGYHLTRVLGISDDLFKGRLTM